jgi:phosphatidylserine/phosphatidylglycerophosphate/cardiolipin synthase-like enzyme
MNLDLSVLLEALEATLADSQLSDAERRELVAALRDASPPEDGLRQLRNHAFQLARAQAAAGTPPAALLQWLEGVMRALDNGRAPASPQAHRVHFSPGEDCLRAIQGRLRGARTRIDLCVFTISDDRISDEIAAAHRRGVALRLLTDNDKAFDAGSDVQRLQALGIPTRVDRSRAHMHHKFALIDGVWLLNGSYNWTRSACELNEENLVLSQDAGLVAAFSARFEQLWQRLDAH